MTEKTEASEIQNKVVRLFTYLEKALSLDDTIVRDFRSAVVAPSPWWLADLPNDVENLQLKQLETENTENEDTEAPDQAWLRVEKKKIDLTPAVPDVLREWIEEVDLPPKKWTQRRVGGSITTGSKTGGVLWMGRGVNLSGLTGI